MFHLRVIFSVVLAMIAMPSAWADPPNCVERGKLVRHLGKKYDERSFAVALGNLGEMYELLKSDSGASWTLLKITVEGKACLIIFGNYWEFLPQLKAKTSGP